MSKTLEWQLRNIRTNDNNGIQYYDLEKNDMQYQMPFCGLVVFTWKVSENLSDNVADLCMKIILVVREKKLPFILCLKNVKAEDVQNNMILLNEITKILQASLDTTHLIIRAESPFGKSHYLVKFDGMQLSWK